jgi:hypothetical protein
LQRGTSQWGSKKCANCNTSYSSAIEIEILILSVQTDHETWLSYKPKVVEQVDVTKISRHKFLIENDEDGLQFIRNMSSKDNLHSTTKIFTRASGMEIKRIWVPKIWRRSGECCFRIAAAGLVNDLLMMLSSPLSSTHLGSELQVFNLWPLGASRTRVVLTFIRQAAGRNLTQKVR